jgi:hypothetical protein
VLIFNPNHASNTPENTPYIFINNKRKPSDGIGVIHRKAINNTAMIGPYHPKLRIKEEISLFRSR